MYPPEAVVVAAKTHITHTYYFQGPRFGGALNEAAEQFSGAFDRKMTPAEFVTDMRKRNEYIMGKNSTLLQVLSLFD